MYTVLYMPKGKVTIIKRDDGWWCHLLIGPCCYYLITGSVLLYYRVYLVLLDKLQVLI